MTKHPAKYTDSFIPIFASYLIRLNDDGTKQKYKNVLDPFGGTGKIGRIKNFGYNGEVYCSEIEQEWAMVAENNPLVDFSIHGDSTNMNWAEDDFFSSICTSPVYGNRISDNFEAKDDSRRITYRSYLGHEPHEKSSGRMNWGKAYRQLHRDVYKECVRVLENKGRFILNISDHIRKGEVIPVSQWHRETLEYFGFILEDAIKIETPRHRFGDNSKLRVDHENIMVFQLNK